MEVLSSLTSALHFITSFVSLLCVSSMFFFFNDTATTEIYTLSLHDALPISSSSPPTRSRCWACARSTSSSPDRKSTRLNSSHANISYAVFCLKKKNIITLNIPEDHQHSNNFTPLLSITQYCHQ